MEQVEAQIVPGFLGSAKTAQEIGDAVEIMHERDLKLEVAQNILQEREELGGS